MSSAKTQASLRKAKVESDAAVTHRNVPCPFCALLCDDLDVIRQGNRLHVTSTTCPKAAAGFDRDALSSSPRIRRESTTLPKALAHAASLLRSASLPLYAGLGTDVNGLRGVMALADATGGVVDHMHSAAAMRNFLVLQEQGWINTTMSEVRNRADFLLFVGTDAVSEFPRFFERAVWAEHSLFGLKPGIREIVYIGRGLDTSPGRGPSRRQPTLHECSPERFAEVLSAMRALLDGARLTARTVAGIRLADLQELVEKMKAARYGVVVWAPGQLRMINADLIVHGICDLVRDLNRYTRFAGFPLLGNDGGMSAASVCGWQSGYPLRTSFARGFPEFDPRRFSTQELLKSGTVDVLVWISSFVDRAPPLTDVPTIAFAVPHAHFKRAPEVYVPVATPGIDHSGQLVRCDSVVSLPLRQLRESPLPSVGAALNDLRGML